MRYDDQFLKREKIRKKHAKNREASSKKLEEVFDLPLGEWTPWLKEGAFIGRVVEVHKRNVFVSREDKPGKIDTKDVWLATVARRFLQAKRGERNFLAVGDVVLCIPDAEDDAKESSDLPSCVVERRSPRSSTLARVDPLNEKRQHLLAVNMSQLIIVSSFLFPKIRWRLIDRYLCLAEEQSLPVTIILNKADLLEELPKEQQDKIAKMIELYQGMGYQVLKIAAQEIADHDLEVLKNLFKDEISLVTGHSGVGKSSIVNLLAPEIVQDVEDEEIFRKGRHTTTYASLIRLGIGGFVIDTPGLRSLVLRDQEAFDLSYNFRDLRPFAAQCRYRGCQHLNEPGCMVLAKLESGEIAKSRYTSYVGILTKQSRREGRGGGHKSLQDPEQV